ncbi:MAG: autoinducer binding domain-containing protein [Rhodobacteraceae bacterium]|nr:autoinducer binding domain-containing protein [Paracoccaceae bacterium]
MDRVKKVSELLNALGEMCDTGYALAIHMRFMRPVLLYECYCREWSDFYDRNGLMLNDPVVHWGLAHNGVRLWDDPTLNDPLGVVRRAHDHGLHNGVAISTGTSASRTITGMTRSWGPFSAPEIERMTCIVETLHQITDGLGPLDSPEMTQLRALGPRPR